IRQVKNKSVPLLEAEFGFLIFFAKMGISLLHAIAEALVGKLTIEDGAFFGKFYIGFIDAEQGRIIFLEGRLEDFGQLRFGDTAFGFKEIVYTLHTDAPLGFEAEYTW